MPTSQPDGPPDDMWLDLDNLLSLDGLDDLDGLDLQIDEPSPLIEPSPQAIILTTHDGTPFWIEPWPEGAEPSIQISVLSPDDVVGWARMSWTTPGELLLGDIRLYPAYRHLGVGSALLREVIALAGRRGVRRIHGFVVERDLQDSPFLLDWYTAHGFTVTPACDEDRARPHQRDAVALLRRELLH